MIVRVRGTGTLRFQEVQPPAVHEERIVERTVERVEVPRIIKEPAPFAVFVGQKAADYGLLLLLVGGLIYAATK